WSTESEPFAMDPATPCPTDEVVLAFVNGRLNEHELAEVDAHIDQCARCAGLLTALVREPSADVEPQANPPAAGQIRQGSISRGSLVERYVVLGPVGSGGLGIVFAAYDPELDRKVALKLLRPDHPDLRDSAGAGERLLREGQALARLTHPNVV